MPNRKKMKSENAGTETQQRIQGMNLQDTELAGTILISTL